MFFIKQFTTVNLTCSLKVDCYIHTYTTVTVMGALERGQSNLSIDVPMVNTFTILVELLIVPCQGLAVVAFVY
jgi:hypothetical protein